MSKKYLNNNQVKKFLEEQLKLINTERETDIIGVQKGLESYSITELGRLGWAILNLRISASKTGLGGKTVIDLEPEDQEDDLLPYHLIKTGDVVALEPHGSSKAVKQGNEQPQATVVKVVSNRIVLALQGDLEDNEGIWRVIKLANEITFSRMTKVINHLITKLEKNTLSNVERVLLNLQGPKFGNSINDKNLELFDNSLNPSQVEAIKLALNAEDLTLIHGPPGTGKTHTLIELILQLIKQNLKILVCGPSNLSVDNLVERLSHYKEVNQVRLGHPSRILPSVIDHSLEIKSKYSDEGLIVKDIRMEMDELLSKASATRGRAEKRKIYSELKDLKKDFRAREQNVLNDLLNGSQVILSTLNGSASKNLYNQKFDILIIDEATQALEAECWIAITQCKKVIFAGDHHQLPPTVKSSNQKLEMTLFKRSLEFHGDCIRVMLNEQYRMHQDIMEYSSHNLYEDKLTAHNSVKSHLLKDLEEVDTDSDDIVNTPLLFVDTAGSDFLESSTSDIIDNSNSIGKLKDESKLNIGEVQLALSHLKLLISTGVKPSQIAIISPYNGQVNQLITEIKPNFPEVEIGTVDGFQGREKEAVILSLVRSNFNHEVGFLMDYRRLNVAITRAKRHLCIIGDSDTVMSPQPTSPSVKESKETKESKEDEKVKKIDGAKFLINLGEYLNDRGEVWTPEMYSD